MSRTVLVLSPHLDDAAFSCGGTMALLADAGWRVCMVTAFTRSVLNPIGFALACQTDKGLPADADYMQLRRDEDRVAAGHLGVTDLRWLDLPEAPHRGYDSAPALFGTARPGDEIWQQLVPLLEALRAELVPDLVLAPQGLGSHIDHRQMIQAVLALPDDTRLAFYRDTPYAMRDRSALPHQTLPPMPQHTIGIAAAIDRKVLASCAYGSQLGFQFGGPEAAAAALRAFAAEEGGGVPAERLVGAMPSMSRS